MRPDRRIYDEKALISQQQGVGMVDYTPHALQRMKERNISRKEVEAHLAKAKLQHLRECWNKPGFFQVRGDNTNLCVLVKGTNGMVWSTYREGIPD
jgi:hypothetical protein